jgi:hypothetical protein
MPLTYPIGKQGPAQNLLMQSSQLASLLQTQRMAKAGSRDLQGTEPLKENGYECNFSLLARPWGSKVDPGRTSPEARGLTAPDFIS